LPLPFAAISTPPSGSARVESESLANTARRFANAISSSRSPPSDARPCRERKRSATRFLEQRGPSFRVTVVDHIVPHEGDYELFVNATGNNSHGGGQWFESTRTPITLNDGIDHFFL
jgi:hypothetical protein